MGSTIIQSMCCQNIYANQGQKWRVIYLKHALWAACQNNNSQVVELLLHPRNVVVELAKDQSTGHQRVVSLSTKKQLFDINQISMFDDDDESDSNASSMSQNDDDYKAN